MIDREGASTLAVPFSFPQRSSSAFVSRVARSGSAWCRSAWIRGVPPDHRCRDRRCRRIESGVPLEVAYIGTISYGRMWDFLRFVAGCRLTTFESR
jgi:hypothetical protein